MRCSGRAGRLRRGCCCCCGRRRSLIRPRCWSCKGRRRRPGRRAAPRAGSPVPVHELGGDLRHGADLEALISVEGAQVTHGDPEPPAVLHRSVELIEVLAVADERRRKRFCSGGCGHWWHNLPVADG
ncbi:DUF5958 family protein [Streptomyces sp. NPDC055060]